MLPPLEPARLLLDVNGTPVSDVYGDVYHAAAGGHAQAKYVFLGGNGLPERWTGKPRFVILETGFGLGINFLATWLAWLNAPGRCTALHFVSVEKHPFSVGDLAVAHAAWPEFSTISCELRKCWPALVPGIHRLELADRRIILDLVFGDAMNVLSDLDVTADAFFLDGFSPAKNPDLWSVELCRLLARLARPGATLATWTVAGHVRRALTNAGFSVNRTSGYAEKRQMLVGYYRPESPG